MRTNPAAPAVSIITVVYNGAAAIEATMQSVLGQDWSDREYIVIDGGSTDGTQALVAAQGARIDQFVSGPDRGIYDAMNKGLAMARGEWVLFMNCGDVFAASTSLSTAVHAARPGAEQVVFGAWVRRARGRADVRCLPSLTAGRFNHQAVLYSRSLHASYGRYVSVPGLGTADYLFFATLMAGGQVECVTIDAPIAVIDVTGISAGLPTFSQKHAIDYLCGRTKRWQLLAVLALHPAYFHLKRLLGQA